MPENGLRGVGQVVRGLCAVQFKLSPFPFSIVVTQPIFTVGHHEREDFSQHLNDFKCAEAQFRCQRRKSPVTTCPRRSVAQLGRAPALGAGSRRFESGRSDHFPGTHRSRNQVE